MKDLHHHQTYVIEECAEAYQERRLGRRDFVRRVLMITGSVPLTASALLALGCGDSGDDEEPAAIGVIGFCFGGGQAFELAINDPDIKAAVPYYGMVSAASLDKFGQSNAAFLAMYGATDTRVTSTSADVQARAQAAGKTIEIKVWDGAGHAFFNDTGGSYNETAAKGAWPMTLAWFRKYLRG
jgi:dienelactone hydrolase